MRYLKYLGGTAVLAIGGCSFFTDPELAYPWYPDSVMHVSRSSWEADSVNQGCELSFSFDPEGDHKRLYWRFLQPFSDSSVLFVNESLFGLSPGFYAPVTVDMTDSLHDGENRLRLSDSSLIPEWSQRLLSGRICISRTQPSGSGFTLQTTRAGVDYATFRSSIILDHFADTTVKVLVSSRLMDPSGRAVAFARRSIDLERGLNQRFDLEFNTLYTPKLWSPSAPLLYRYQTSLWVEGGRCIDWISGDFGVRWFTFSARDGFQINGVPDRLRATVWTPSADPELILKELNLLRAAGANAVYFRTPPPDYVLMLCDRFGVIALCNLPLELTEAGIPNLQKNIRALEQYYANHPSVALVGYGNEPAQRRTDKMNTEDLLAASNQIFTSEKRIENNRMAVLRNSETLLRLADVSVYPMEDPGLTYPFDTLKTLQQNGPEMPVLPMIRIPSSSRSPMRAAAVFDAMNTLPNYINGCIFNSLTDAGADSGYGFFESGTLAPKDDFYLTASRWGTLPVARISRYLRPDMVRQDIVYVRVFSNLPEAELFLNGVSQGTAQAPFGEWRIEVPAAPYVLSVKTVSPEGVTASDEWIVK